MKIKEISKKKAVVFAIVAVLIASMSTVSLADWTPGDGHKMHFPQLPDENGWAVYATAGLDTYGYPEICLADDWLCTETGPVLDIHFWGAWKNGIEGNILAFVIAIADDIPASQNPDGYSKPGTTLWERTFEFWDVVPIDPPSTEGWYDPYWDEVIYDDHVPYFQYNIVDIPNPFYQDVDTIYWLSISAIVAYEPTGFQPLWGWKSSIDHWNDDAVWAEWYYLDWIDLWEPSPPIVNHFWIGMDPGGNPDPMFTGGTDYYDDGHSVNGWYYYPETEWWNIWFYDHPFDETRMKEIFTSFEIRKYFPEIPSYVEVAINWATDLWPPDSPPPLPPDDEPYIGREIIFIGQDIEQGFYEEFYEILDYNPEWVSIDVRGYNFIIENGLIEHSCLGSLDLAFVITGEQPGEAIVEIEKTVWDSTLQEWVEEIDAEVGETVSFQIDVHNNGTYDLTNIFVTDTLPACLEYVEGSADPAPSDIVGNMIIWDFPGPLSYCNTITINFDADVVSDGINTNVVDVTADADDGSIVTDQDTAIVHATEPSVPSVDIEKYVWNETLGEWVDEISAEVCTIIRFKLSIHNTGQVTLIVTKVWDILPPCLEYADSATVNGMLWEPDVIMPPIYEWNYPLPAGYWYPGSEPGELPPDEWIYIEFDAHVIFEGININEACVDADSAEGPVSDCDTAIVHATEPCTPSIDVEKYVWDETLGDWVDADTAQDALDVPVGTDAEYLIAIHNDGECCELDITVYDFLEDSMDYVSANPTPTFVNPVAGGTEILWFDLGPLSPCEWINITVYATVLGPACNTDYNYVSVEAYCESIEEYVYDEDYAYVHATEEPWPNHKMHYPQLPDPYGWDVLANWEMPFMPLADDWMCSETGPVTDIHFWGSWYLDIEGFIDGFDISIWNDIPASQSPTGYSMPGMMLWSQYFSNYDMIDMTPSPQGWYDPFEVWFDFENHFNYYQYNIENIIEPFIQQNETIYWLCIHPNVVESMYPMPPLWGWKTSQDHWNDDAVYWCEYNPPYCWMELREPPDFITPIDLSFVITGYTDDITPPVISNVVMTTSDPLDTNAPYGWENVSCTVIDAGVGVDEVKLIVTDPNAVTTEYPMTKNGDTYYYETTFTFEGCYEYYIWADDTSDNEATSPTELFELPPNEDVDMNGQIHFMDLVAIVLIYGDTGPNGWVREDVDNNGQAHFMDLVAIVLRYGEYWDKC